MVNQTADSGSIGAGQQDPEDSTSEFAVAVFIVRQMMALLETMMPVEVTNFHPGTGSPPSAGTVDVQLLVSQLDGAGNAVKHGVVYGLPCFRMQGGPWAVVCDPAVNDFGVIISAARDISKVVANPGVQVPGSLRKYSYSDGVYFGGTFNQVPAASVWLKSDGSMQITDKFGNQIASSSTGLTMTDINGNEMQMKVGAVNFITGALQVNGVPIVVP